MKKSKKKNDNNKILKYGIIGAIIASACCWLPLIIVALGIGTAGSALAIGYNSIYFLVAAGVFFCVMVLYILSKDNKKCADGSCSVDSNKNFKTFAYAILGLILLIGLAYIIKDVLVPLIAPAVYK